MSKPRNTQRLLLAAVALTGLTALAGCGALVVGGAAATTAVVATDRRTAGEQVEDQAIEMKASAEMRRLFEDRARVKVTSYGGLVLLTGDVPTAQDKSAAEAAAKQVEKVKRVVNELRVGELTTLSVRTNDTWLTSKIRSTLINTKEVPSRTIVVTTERGVAYLMGKVTDTEGQRAAKATASVGGLSKVVKLFDIVSPESIAAPDNKPATVVEAAPADANPATPASGTGGAEAIPVQ